MRRTKGTAPQATEPEVTTETEEVSIAANRNESIDERREKRVLETANLQTEVENKISQLIESEFGFELRVIVTASRFTLGNLDDQASFIESALDDIHNKFYTVTAVDDPIFQNAMKGGSFNTPFEITENLSLQFYDVETEYGSIEPLFDAIIAWKKQNPRPINDEASDTILREVGLHIRVKGDGHGYQPAYGNLDDVLKTVYTKIASGFDENGLEIQPMLAEKPIPLASRVEEADEGTVTANWIADILHKSKYNEPAEFEEAYRAARAKAITILATRYNLHVGIPTNPVYEQAFNNLPSSVLTEEDADIQE